MIIIYTIQLITLALLLNCFLAFLYNEQHPSSKKVKYILLIPPMAILIWSGMIIITVFISLQNGLVEYFKEGDEE
jgi:ABC-type sugar transport system permease subunit